MGWRDRQGSRVRANEPGPDYPWVQWVNYGNNLDPRRQAGGFFITADNLAVLNQPEIAGCVPSTQHFKGGGSEEGVFCEFLDVAVVETRFAWQVSEGRNSHLQQDYVKGARSKHHALAFLRTAEGGYAGPIILTHTGMVTQDIQDAIQAHREVVRKATAGQGASAWFWMRLTSGEVTEVGSGAKVSTYTPVCYVGVDFEPDEFYVGDELADWMEDNFERTLEWVEEWGTPQPDDPEPDTNEPECQPAQAPAQHSAPAARQQAPSGHGQGSYNAMGEARKTWSVNWNALKQAGVVAPFMDNSWSAAQVRKASEYMQDALDEIERGGDKDAALSALHTRLDTIE